MSKPRINKDKLNKILAANTSNVDLDSQDLATTLKIFCSDYLKGLVSVKINGYATGRVSIRLPDFSYFIRLLCEDAYDETIKCEITLDDDLTIRTTYPSIRDDEKTVYLFKVASIAGFDVDRDGDILIFKTKIHATDVLQVYAISSTEIMDMLIAVYEM
jgi:hypothetical protein